MLIKCGELGCAVNDLLYVDTMLLEYPREEENAQSVPGAGETLASAICCNLAEGFSVEMAVRNAKAYLAGAIKAGTDSATGTSCVEHTYNISRVSN